MAAVFAFLGMLLISMVVALLAALQLGDFLNSSEGFGLIILGVAAFTILAMAVFALVYTTTRWARALTSVALVLAAVAFAPVAVPGLVQAIADRSTFDAGRNLAVGMDTVLVNGEPVLLHEQRTQALPGRDGAIGRFTSRLV